MQENENKNTEPALETETGSNKAKKRSVSVPAVAIIVAVSVLITFMTTYVLVTQKYVNDMKNLNLETGGLPEDAFEKLVQIKQLLGSEFLYDIDDEALADMVLKGYMYGTGDPYAEYFTKEEFKTLMADTNAEMQGIGISVASNAENAAVQIIAVFPESPALEAGVLPGDLITHVKVDGQYESVSELGYTMALSCLQGEAGTKAEFVVMRGEGYSERVEFSIERGFITEYTVMHRVHSEDSSVGIIKITSFDKKTPEQFRAAYDDLLSKGCTKLVMDVRNNPGGELVSVCTVLDMLVPKGPVIRTVDKAGNEEVVYTSDKEETDVPIAVLTNSNTASAGELFSACLRDYEKAFLVGEKTFGKGSMQTTRTFSDGTAFKYTYRYYCPPFSDNYDGVGLEPDIKAELPEDVLSHFYTMTDSEDTQLARAVEELNKK